MIKEAQHHKTADLQRHFDIEDEELEATLDQFVEDDGVPEKKRKRLNFPIIAGGVFLVSAIIIGLREFTGASGAGDRELLSFLVFLGGILVFAMGLGIAGVKNKRKWKHRRKSSKKKASTTFDSSTEKKQTETLDQYGLKKKKKLFRSSSNSMLFGVCGGIAEYFNIDPTIVRIAFAISTIYYGSSIILYLILAIILPKRGDDHEDVDIDD